MQNYILCEITCDPSQSEFLMAEMAEAGYEGFLETDEGFSGYLPKSDFNEELLLGILDQYGLGPENLQISEVAQENWNQAWESSFEPVVIAGRLLIRAPFHDADPSMEREIVIQPKTSFGTGHHETTSGIMQLMMKYEMRGKKVLDFGSGTGILAILASQLGATHIFANDIDDWAAENIHENMQLNGVENIEFMKGDISVIPNEKYDIILANINKNVLMDCIPQLANHLEKQALLMMSGFYLSDLSDIEKVAVKAGLTFKESIVTNEWTAVVFTV